MPITSKQRGNAERELNSTTCAGCNGLKPGGCPFCRLCTNVLLDNGFPLQGMNDFAEKYTERVEFLLSRKGQRLRLAA